MPLVLLTADRRAPVGHKPGAKLRPHRPETFLAESYSDAVRAVGATPILLPPGHAELDELLSAVDAVVLTGGYFDIHPSHYGEAVTGRLDRIEESRTSLELAVARRCLAEDVPVLGICGGMQLLAVATGGTLIQHLDGPPTTLEHEQPTDPATGWHRVRCEGPLAGWLGATVHANSTHHQAVADPGAFTACAWSEDDVIEGMAHPDHRFAVAVQWHPELLGDTRLYAAMLRA